jgi:hypothetical protein
MFKSFFKDYKADLPSVVILTEKRIIMVNHFDTLYSLATEINKLAEKQAGYTSLLAILGVTKTDGICITLLDGWKFDIKRSKQVNTISKAEKRKKIIVANENVISMDWVKY